MSNRQIAQKVVNTFVKGLVTERAELTFPPDASIDELNCDLRREGFRRRREAVALEVGSVASTFTTNTDDVIWNGTWFNVAGDNEKEYEIVQVGSVLYFYDKVDAPFSATQITSQAVQLSSFEFASNDSVSNHRCQFSSINGICIVTNPAMDTVFLQEAEDGTITATEITHRVRDFTYQTDRVSLIDPVSPDSAATDARKYDTANSGWVGNKGVAALDAYIASESEYPALNLPWFSGKDANGDFSVTEWQKIQAGSSLVSNGHFILDFFTKDRKTASGFANVLNDTEDSRFSTSAAFSGRVFYAGLTSSDNSGTVLFTRQLDAFSSNATIDTSGLGECYQVNDPTSEELSDLLDTDGGVIRIQEAYNIRKLHVFNNSLFVFAENGVWQIRGIDDVFRATAFSVNQLTGAGLDGPQSFCSANGVPFWWSEFGIHTLGFDPNSFQPSENNISIETIQSFFDNIDLDVRRKVISKYDPINKRIFWAYPSNDETHETKYNNFLILDIPLQAYYPWQVADQSSNTNSVVGMVYYTGIGSSLETVNVILSNGDDVVTSAGDNVVSQLRTAFDTGEPAIVLLVRDGSTGTVTMAQFNNSSFLDWGDANYSSFAESGHDFMGSMTLKKNVLKLDIKMRVTEEGFTGNETDGYEAIRPSSLIVKSFWDFASTEANSQQAYRLTRPVVVDSGDLSNFDYPETVVSTKLKIRGKGESVRFRFESEEGKDFVLLGYGYIVASNTGM